MQTPVTVSLNISGPNAASVQHELREMAAPLFQGVPTPQAPVAPNAQSVTTSAPAEKPSVYRAKNAENIATTLISKVQAGEMLTDDDLDNISGPNAASVQHELREMAAPLFQGVPTPQAPVAPNAQSVTTSAPAAPEPADEPAEKPSVYRAKNAENIATTLISKVQAGEMLTDDDLDDISRLPKKWQDQIKEASKDDPEPEPPVTEPDSAAEPEAAPYTITANGQTDVFDTIDEWVGAMVEAINSTSDMDDLTKLSEQNRPMVKRVSTEVEDQELLKPVAEAYAERRDGFQSTEEPAADSAEEASGEAAASSDAPTADDAREALKRLLKDAGTGPAEKILKSFGASKVSELKLGDIAKFIAEVDKQLAADDVLG